MKTRLMTLGLIALLTPSIAAAACQVFNGTVGSCLALLESMEVGDPNYVLIEVNSGSPNGIPCTEVGGYWRVSKTAPNYPEFYQAFLLAIATDAQVIFTTKPSNTFPICELEKIAIQN